MTWGPGTPSRRAPQPGTPGAHTHLRRASHGLQQQRHEGLVALRGQDAVLGQAHLQPQGAEAAPAGSDGRRSAGVSTGKECGERRNQTGVTPIDGIDRNR